MQINAHHDFTSLTSAQAIYEAILTERDLDPKPSFPTLQSLIPDLNLNKDNLANAKNVLESHLQKGSDILVYGDYDVDGVTSTSILFLTLNNLAKGTSSRILPFIPHRNLHGYGISPSSLEEIFSGAAFQNTAYPDFSPSLIITVDTGIVAHTEIKSLLDRGVDVILTDHHQPASTLPEATSIVHSTTSSGAGLAWVFSLYLTDEAQFALDLLDLATLGIVADLLPLTGVNRQLVYHGLKVVNNSKRPGLLALRQVAKLMDQDSLSVSDLSFRLAPRLNAAGRLADATTALRLLCTNDKSLSNKLAKQLDEYNRERQLLTDSGVKHALSQNSSDKLIIVASTDYHEGVVGLIAGRLVERFQRPALAISLSDELSKGSARSVKGINITSLLRKFESEFLGLGGHELAAGFSFSPDKLAKLSTSLINYANEHISDDLLEPEYSVDAILNLSQISLSLVKLLNQLAPFGIGNPRPRFVSHNLNVLEDRFLGSEGQHRRLTLEQNGETRQAIWFNCQLKEDLSKLSSLVYTIDLNLWKNKAYLQLIVKHAEI
jgi:single-stranded-DNA-specific exonuclease